MVIDSLLPVFALLIMGRLLTLSGMIDRAFLRMSDRLVYFIFFPCMLFWKVGGNPAATGIDMALPVAALCALFLVFVLSTLTIVFGNVSGFEAGTFSQSCYRFNTYIGMAIVFNALGDAGVLQFGIIIGVLIPVINILCVSVLIWYSGKDYSLQQRIWYMARAIISNPLIIACFAGILFSRTGLVFPRSIHNTFSLISMVTLPLALLSIGSSFSFSGLRGYIRLALVSSAFKLVLLPLAGMLFMMAFNVGGTAFKAGMIFFCLPTSSAIYVLSSQMNSDTDLAAATIVLSTLLSIIPLSLVLSFI